MAGQPPTKSSMRHNGVDYRYTWGSDLRDGLFLEVVVEPDNAHVIIDIFYSEVTRDMAVTLFESDVPLEVVEWAISEARNNLPPMQDGTAQ